MTKQLEFKSVGGWGGRRRGAGRPNRSGQVAHGRRAPVSVKTPVHITLRVRKGIIHLRNEETHEDFREAIRHVQAFGLYINHYCLRGNHLHLIAEAQSSKHLARGMRSFGCRFGKAIRKATGETGPVFDGRYHLHVLKTPTEMKNALRYVLVNDSKHRKVLAHVDDFSSGQAFRDWPKLVPRNELLSWQLRGAKDAAPINLVPFKSWLGRSGWATAAKPAHKRS